MNTEPFDPMRHVENAGIACDREGVWPAFHDARIYTLNIWHGDLRPDDNIWIGPQIDVTLGLLALDDAPLETVKLRFSDCDDIELKGMSYGGAMIQDLDFAFEKRGFRADGVTPLPPYIRVVLSFGPGAKPLLQFRCFKVTALARSAPHGPPFF
jgi:hypothetical protein